MVDVSVIVPVYNAETYLDACVQSLLSQTLSTIEIVLVNDGSTDGSGALCDRYAAADARVTVVHQDNKGASAARNAGIRHARGTYIGFVDSDDFVEPTMYQWLYEEAEANEADIVFCNLFTNDQKMLPYLADGVYEGERLRQEIYPRLIAVVDETKHGKVLRGAVWCRIFKRELLLQNEILFHEGLIYNEDGLFCVQSTLKCARYAYLGQEFLYHHILVEGSITKRYIPNLWSTQKAMIDELKACTAEAAYDFSEQIAKKVFDIAVYSIENEAKRSNQKSLSARCKIIKEIVNDPLLIDAIAQFDGAHMSRVNRAYYRFIRSKSALMLLVCAKYRYRNNKLF